MDFDSQRKVSFVSGSGRLCQISSKLVQNCDRESTDRQTDTHTHLYIHRDHTGDLISVPCYAIAMGQIIKKVTEKSHRNEKSPLIQCYATACTVISNGGFDTVIFTLGHKINTTDAHLLILLNCVSFLSLLIFMKIKNDIPDFCVRALTVAIFNRF